MFIEKCFLYKIPRIIQYSVVISHFIGCTTNYSYKLLEGRTKNGVHYCTYGTFIMNRD